MGVGWSIGWRVLDAQYWGVPQRRRRIALVADFGGTSAPEILFKRESVSGNSEPGSTKRQRTPPLVENSVNPAIERNVVTYGLGRDALNQDANARFQMQIEEELIPTCTVRGPGAVSVSYGIGNGQVASAQSMVAEKAQTLDTMHDTQKVLCIQGSMIGRKDENGPTGSGFNEGTSFTLNTIDRHAVCYGICSDASNSMRSNNPNSGIYKADTARTIDQNGGNPACNQGGMVVLDMTHACDVIRDCGKTVPTLQSRMGTGGNQIPLVASVDCRNGTENADVNGTLQAKPNGGFSLNCNGVVRVYLHVRRMTPLECERLQGFPDGWTDIGAWTDTKGKTHKESSDAARYRALGNSIAAPPWKWVLKRICAEYERDATMGSLFDGIGGFPLIWEQINGKGSCLWASEIEEFPIAVTKYHFAEGGNDNDRIH